MGSSSVRSLSPCGIGWAKDVWDVWDLGCAIVVPPVLQQQSSPAHQRRPPAPCLVQASREAGQRTKRRCRSLTGQRHRPRAIWQHLRASPQQNPSEISKIECHFRRWPSLLWPCRPVRGRADARQPPQRSNPDALGNFSSIRPRHLPTHICAWSTRRVSEAETDLPDAFSESSLGCASSAAMGCAGSPLIWAPSLPELPFILPLILGLNTVSFCLCRIYGGRLEFSL